MNNDINHDKVEKIRNGKIDINNHELFFSILIKGLMTKLNEDICIRNIPVPHYITHTGTDIVYLEHKGQDNSVEPYEVSNENYIYSTVPRCAVIPGTVVLTPDQLTNPHTHGQLQYEDDETIINLTGEFRRIPVKINIDLKYIVSSYRDMLELLQQMITKLYFVRTYNIIYMGQIIKCAYQIPDNFDEEHMTDLDGATQDLRDHVMTFSVEVETNLPVYNHKSLMANDVYIKRIYLGDKEVCNPDSTNITGIKETNGIVIKK